MDSSFFLVSVCQFIVNLRNILLCVNFVLMLQVRMNVSGSWSVRDVWDSGWDSSGETINHISPDKRWARSLCFYFFVHFLRCDAGDKNNVHTESRSQPLIRRFTPIGGCMFLSHPPSTIRIDVMYGRPLFASKII